MLEVRNLNIAFRTASGLRPVVNNVSLEIKPGEILGLVGESGSGKTMLSLGIMRLLPPNALVTKGEVLMHGTDLLKLDGTSLRKLRGRRISMIFQDPQASLDAVFTCGDQIVEALLVHERIGAAEARRRAIELLEKVRIPDPARCMRSYPHELSGGQCQRVMIAMAIACKPEVIIADEPTTALDVTVQKQVLDLLKGLNEEVGAAILLITHDLGVIYETADRVIVMYNGNLMEEATTEALFRAPKDAYTRALIDSMPSLGSKAARLPVIERDAEGGVRSTLRPAAVKEAAVKEAPVRPAPEALLSVRNLSKTYWIKDGPLARPRPLHAVSDVSFSIPQRTTLGLVGESGCGKSTISRLLMRLMRPDAGQILFNGADLAQIQGRGLQNARRDIAMVFQNPYGSLNPRQKVADLVSAPLIIHGQGGNAAARRREVASLIDAVGLPANALEKYPHEFSGGQRQRIAIARALALRPLLVICDEAVSALDVSVQAQVLNLLRDLQAEFDLTYLFISHDLSVVEHISDSIAVMQSGKIVESGPAEQVFARPASDYTRKLLDAVPKIGIARDSAKEPA